MWHVSIKGRGDLIYSVDLLRRFAREQLEGVGDARLGEWEEVGHAFHLRRRLTPDEAAAIGPVVDVRDTPEGARRYHAVQRFLPRGFTDIV